MRSKRAFCFPQSLSVAVLRIKHLPPLSLTSRWTWERTSKPTFSLPSSSTSCRCFLSPAGSRGSLLLRGFQPNYGTSPQEQAPAFHTYLGFGWFFACSGTRCVRRNNSKYNRGNKNKPKLVGRSCSLSCPHKNPPSQAFAFLYASCSSLQPLISPQARDLTTTVTQRSVPGAVTDRNACHCYKRRGDKSTSSPCRSTAKGGRNGRGEAETEEFTSVSFKFRVTRTKRQTQPSPEAEPGDFTETKLNFYAVFRVAGGKSKADLKNCGLLK